MLIHRVSVIPVQLVPTNMDQTYVGIMLTANSSITDSSSSVPITITHSTDRHQGKVYGEHGGARTRADDRRVEHVHNDGHTGTLVATKDHE